VSSPAFGPLPFAEDKYKPDNEDAFLFGLLIVDEDAAAPGAPGSPRYFVGGVTWDGAAQMIVDKSAWMFLVMCCCETQAEAHALSEAKGGLKAA
jgi:hypothetical protein